jgi:hypothetical protein
MPSPEQAERHLGIIGAGKMGVAIARLAIVVGYEVALSGSGTVDRIALIVEVLAPGALARSTEEVVAYADLIVLALPMHRFRELPRDLLAGKTVIDAMNYWEETDGVDDELAAAPRGTSVVVQQWFSFAKVVKTLNQLGYDELEEVARSPGASGCPPMAVAGDDPDAVGKAIEFIERLGFEGVAVGPLASGLKFEISQ